MHMYYNIFHIFIEHFKFVMLVNKSGGLCSKVVIVRLINWRMYYILHPLLAYLRLSIYVVCKK